MLNKNTWTEHWIAAQNEDSRFAPFSSRNTDQKVYRNKFRRVTTEKNVLSYKKSQHVCCSQKVDKKVSQQDKSLSKVDFQ